jgi:multiple sugar transport system permease protein
MKAKGHERRAKRPFLSCNHQLNLFLIPYLLGSLLLVLIPALITLVAAFTDYDLIAAPVWVGLENFRRMFQSAFVRTGLENSIFFIALAVPLRLLGALSLALLLQNKRRLFGMHRTAVYIPTVIPPVAYALLWLWIFNPVYGPLNITLGWLGLPTPAWLANPDSARTSIVIMSLFQIGEGFVVLMAGLQSIPRSFYESAKVDGASGLQSFFKITLPLITPWLLLLTFRDLLVSVESTFTPSFVMTYGGPDYATTFAPLLVYELAFDFFDFGLAAAFMVSFFILMVMLIVSIIAIVGLQGVTDEA